jgi:A/G-specific adenine glycosylase
MLQQTQVDRVVPAYERFLAQFPTLKALAAAPASQVIRAWVGLGYNRRAVNLQRTVRHIVEELGGEFPTEVEALRALPGVGPYTSGAIACFAFERDVAFIDTNIRRVLHRLYFGVDVPAPSVSDRELLRLAGELLPPAGGWTWNQALIEFGALQCTARKPLCVVCPLQTVCCAFPAIQTALAEIPRVARTKQRDSYSDTNRFYRGRVVDALRGAASTPLNTGLSLTDLGRQVRPGYTTADEPWLFEVVQGLARDGLAHVGEERSHYAVDVTGETTPGEAVETRVKLPG